MTKREALQQVFAIAPEDFGKFLGAVIIRMLANFGVIDTEAMLKRLINPHRNTNQQQIKTMLRTNEGIHTD